MNIVIGDLESNGFVGVADRVHCGVFKNITTGVITKFYQGTHVDYVEAMLSFLDEQDVLIFHNGIRFDFPLLRNLYNWEPSPRHKIVDTLWMSRLQDPNRKLPYNCPNKRAGPHSVEAWGYRLGRGKPDHEDWENFSMDMLHRCTEDVEIQHLIYQELLREGKGRNWKNAHMLTFKLFQILQKQEEFGWAFDSEYANEKIGMLTHWIDRIDKVLESHLPMKAIPLENKVKGIYNYVKKPFLKSGKPSASVINTFGNRNSDEPNWGVSGPFSRVEFRPVSMDSNQETKDFLLKEGWIPQEWNLDENGNNRSPKMSKGEKFEGINGKVGKLIAKRVQIRHRRSQIQGWLDRVREDGRLPSVVTGIADTGRMKHSVIVNVPNAGAFFGKQMRKCFTAPEGRVLVSVDADSCQNKMLGQRANSPELSRLLIEEDTHTLVMNAVNTVCDKYSLVNISRGKAKGVGFAYRFGASDNKLGALVGGNKDIGTEIRAAIDAVFPAQAALLDRLTAEWEKNAKVRMNNWGKPEYYDGWIEGLDGRPIMISSPHAILVYMLQSDEAIMMSSAYVMMYKKLIAKGYKWGEDFGIVCFYHDEITIECREEIAEEIKPIMEEAISASSDYYNMSVCPQTGTAEIGKDWLAVH